MVLRRRFWPVLGLMAPLVLSSGPARAWFWDEAPPAPPPPVHVYDYSRGPVWTANGWAYVPVEVHFPRDRPPVLAMPPPPPPPPHRPRVSERRPKRPPAAEYPNMIDPPLPKLPPLRKNLK